MSGTWINLGDLSMYWRQPALWRVLA